MESNFDQEFAALRKEYLDGLLDDLDQVEQLTIDLPKSQDPQGVFNKVLRIIHTAKGAAGGYEFHVLTTICHQLEDLMTGFDGPYTSDRLEGWVDPILEYLDQLKSAQRIYLEGGVPEVKEPKPQQSQSKEGFHRALIVEGSRIAQKQYAKALQTLKVNPAFAKDGYEALGRLLHEKFDSILTSGVTNAIGGTDLIATLKLIHSRNKTIPTILVSSTLKKDLEIEPDYFVPKDKDMVGTLKGVYEQILSPKGGREAPLRKIAFIDDSEDIHTLIKLGFKRAKNTEIKCFTTGKDIEGQLEAFAPDMIFLDLNMPDKSGEECLTSYKGHPTLKSLPVVFLTGTGNLEKKKDLKNLGAADVLTKPFNPKTLPGKIQSIWENL